MQYAKGCMAAAWDDITRSSGWFRKSILLGLINMVPILNFYVMGYAMKWSKQLVYGQIEQMPDKIMQERSFTNGWFAFLITLVFGLVGSFICSIFAIVPILGFIAGMAAIWFVMILGYLGIERCAIADRLSSGFDISRIWSAAKRSFGQLFCAAIIPYLIVDVIVTILSFIVIMIFALPMLGQIISISAYSYDSYAYLAQALSIIGWLIPMLLVTYCLSAIFGAFSIVWSMRGIGHYVARYASDWPDELSYSYYQSSPYGQTNHQGSPYQTAQEPQQQYYRYEQSGQASYRSDPQSPFGQNDPQRSAQSQGGFQQGYQQSAQQGYQHNDPQQSVQQYGGSQQSDPQQYGDHRDFRSGE